MEFTISKPKFYLVYIENYMNSNEKSITKVFNNLIELREYLSNNMEIEIYTVMVNYRHTNIHIFTEEDNLFIN